MRNSRPGRWQSRRWFGKQPSYAIGSEAEFLERRRITNNSHTSRSLKFEDLLRRLMQAFAGAFFFYQVVVTDVRIHRSRGIRGMNGHIHPFLEIHRLV